MVDYPKFFDFDAAVKHPGLSVRDLITANTPEKLKESLKDRLKVEVFRVAGFTPSNINLLLSFINCGFNIDIVGGAGRTVLHSLAESKQCGYKATEILVTNFLENGVDVNAKCSVTGETALHIVSRKKNLPMIEILLRNGAFLDILDANGNTPFKNGIADKKVMNVFMKFAAIRIHGPGNTDEQIMECINSKSDLLKNFKKIEKRLRRLQQMYINSEKTVSYFDVLYQDKFLLAKILKSERTDPKRCVDKILHKIVSLKMGELIDILDTERRSFWIVNECFGYALPYLCIKRIAEFLNEMNMPKPTRCIL